MAYYLSNLFWNAGLIFYYAQIDYYWWLWKASIVIDSYCLKMEILLKTTGLIQDATNQIKAWVSRNEL